MHSLLKHTLENLKTNFKLNITASIVIALLFLIFNLLLFSSFISKQVTTQLKSKITFNVYLRNDTDLFTVRRLIETLEKRDDVSSPIVYISQEEAQKSFAESMGLNDQFFKKINLTFPANLNIKPKNPSDEKNIRKFLEASSLNQYLMKTPESELIRESKTFETVSSNLEKLQKITNSLVSVLIGFMILIGILVIFITLKLTADIRKKELFIMKLVGASPQILEFPYVLEGIIITICGLIVGTILTLIVPGVFFTDQFLIEAYKNFGFLNIFILELMTAILIGLIGSSLMAHKLLFSKKTLHLTL